jgi:putative N6-adenine-specific DNA methylase
MTQDQHKDQHIAGTWQFQETGRFFAQTQKELESLARQELEELGAVRCDESYCGVYFSAQPADLYRINYCARLVHRVLAPLFSFRCHSDKVLYQKARQLPWEKLFSIHHTFAVSANVSNSKISHSKFAALRLKDAVADRFRDKFSKRPDVDAGQPDLRLNLSIRNNKAVISLDTSGESLHRRGYRVEPVAAPMQESLAAAILRISQWDGETPLIDPMCGSGTLLAEALMKYCRIPSGFKRNWRKGYGFVHLPGFDERLWKKIKKEADSHIRPCPGGLISGGDIDAHAVDAARRNLNRVPGGDTVSIRRLDFRDIGETTGRTLVTNPPYGHRIGEKEQLFTLYRQLGDALKQQCKHSTAWILCGDKELTKHIGLKISRRIPLFNGPIESRLVKIEVY